MIDELVARTHPIIASLDHPLFAFGGKRENKNKDNPLSAQRREGRARRVAG
jgi:hypothetical protein